MTDTVGQGVRFAGALAAVALLAGCATAPPMLAASDKAKATYAAQALLEVPFHPQREYQCGPASLAMALNASDASVTVDEMIPAVFLPGRRGSVQPEMMATPRRYGRVSYPVGSTLDALFSEVAAGHPVIVLQNLGLKWFPVWHYAVVVGYDVDAGHVTLHSGTTEHARMSIARFDRTWARGDRWAMVALAPDALPVAVNARAAVEAIHHYERVAGSAAAGPAWVAATERWPDDAVAWFARGNAHYARRELMEAREAFEAAVVLQPDLGPGWINLGYLYNELGEVPNALTALRTAVAIAGPWQSAAEAALERLERMPVM